MRLKHHGGHCCGIKHIEGLAVGPYKVDEMKLPEISPNYSYSSNDICVLPGLTEFPAGTYKERLGHYINWQKTQQPAGLIEVTTHDCKYHLGGTNYTTQTDWWREELEKTGFKAVTEFHNSNSSRRVTVWHYAYGTANETKAEGEE